jgi:general secretion pathway protein E
VASLEPGILESSLAALGIDPSEKEYENLLKEPVGCESCRKLGFRGRVAIYEILRMSEALHELVVKRESSRVLRDQAVFEGMKTLQRCGWDQAKRGVTSLQEIMKFSDILEGENL